MREDASCARSARSTTSAKARPDKRLQNLNVMLGYPEAERIHDSRRRRLRRALGAHRTARRSRRGPRRPAGGRARGNQAAQARSRARSLFEAPQHCASVVTTNEIKAAPRRRQRRTPRRIRRRCAPSSATPAAPTPVPASAASVTHVRRRVRPLRCSTSLPAQVVVASTGVIGVPLPMDRVQRGLDRAVAQLDDRRQGGVRRGRSDHDDRSRAEAGRVRVLRRRAHATSSAASRKGSGMIAPNMATMLAFIATDFPLSRAALAHAARARAATSQLQHDLGRRRHVDQRCRVRVRSGDRKRHAGARSVRAGLRAVCLDLARAMVADGEGATKTLEMRVSEARERRAGALDRAGDRQQQPRQDRALRRGSELGTNHRGGWLGARGHRSAALVAVRQRKAVGRRRRDRAAFGSGGASRARAVERRRRAKARPRRRERPAWGCDLSRDYVRINASYRT